MTKRQLGWQHGVLAGLATAFLQLVLSPACRAQAPAAPVVNLACPDTAVVTTPVTCTIALTPVPTPAKPARAEISFSPDAGGGTRTLALAAAAVPFSKTFSQEGTVTITAQVRGDAPASATVRVVDALTLACPANAVVGNEVDCQVKLYRNAAAGGSGEVTVAVGGKAVFLRPDATPLQSDEASVPLLFQSLPPHRTQTAETITATAAEVSSAPETITVLPSGTYGGGQIFRLVAGEQAVFYGPGETAAKPFGDLYYEIGMFCGDAQPKGFCNRADAADFGSPVRLWLQADMFAKNSSYASLASEATTLTAVANAAEAFRVRLGGSVRLASPQIDLGGIPHGGDRSTVELVWGGGATTPDAPAPLTSSNSSSGSPQAPALPPVYCLLASGCSPLTGAKPPSPTAGAPPEYEVLLPATRVGFLWNWEAGLRLQTFYDKLTDSHQPAVTDITLGENAAVTDGRMNAPVLGVEGFWPLPGAVDYAFLTFDANVQMGGGGIGYQFPLNLTPVVTTGYTGPLTGPQFRQISYVENGDEFRVGLTVDVVDFIRNHISSLFAAPKPGQ